MAKPNLQGDVALEWADGTYSFRLTVNGAIELEQKCEAAIAVIAARIQSGVYSVADVRETIRIGLIGGGLKPEKAARLVKIYVDERPLAESHAVARVVIGGLMFGFEAAPFAQAAPAESPSASSPTRSTAPQPFAGLEDFFPASPSGNGLH